jgi:hypothetical protein
MTKLAFPHTTQPAADAWNGEARCYRLDPPLESDNLESGVIDIVEYVIVSATIAPMTGPETYIFAADENARILDWMELEGSYRGGLDHELALENAGYTVVGYELAAGDRR